MAKRLYDYCVTKPYFSKVSNADRILIKKTAIIYALEEDENIDEVMAVVDDVVQMFAEGK